MQAPFNLTCYFLLALVKLEFLLPERYPNEAPNVCVVLHTVKKDSSAPGTNGDSDEAYLVHYEYYQDSLQKFLEEQASPPLLYLFSFPFSLCSSQSKKTTTVSSLIRMVKEW